MNRFKRTLSIVLSVAMLLQMGITPAFAAEATTTTKTVTAFAELAEDEKSITLPLGSTEDEVKAALPKTLTATVETVTDEGSTPKPPAQDSGQPPVQEVTPGEDGDTNAPPAEEKIPDEDGDTNAPPAEDEIPDEDGIATPGNATETVQSFSVRGTTAIGLSTVSGQPTGTGAEPAKSTTAEEQVAVTWLLAEGEMFSPETAGAFTYTASLSGSGYTLAEGVRLPEIKVMVEAMAAVMSLDHNISTGSLILGATDDGCSAANPHAVTGNSSDNKIEVTGGTHHIKIKDLTLNYFTGDLPFCKFSIASGAAVHLTLEGTNTINTIGNFAAISVPVGATLVIEDSTGTLNVTGGNNAAGIGGNQNASAGTITINGGTIVANGDTNLGAGIGGGSTGNGGIITINGGTVTATGGSSSAGIGGGYRGNGGTITINGGTVTANVNVRSGSGVGIGGGDSGSGGTITINGGTVTATGTSRGAGIGSGNNGKEGTVTIDGDALVFATGGGDTTNGLKAQDIGNGWGGGGITVHRTKGIIFEGSTGAVYGDVTLQDELTIDAGKLLIISEGASLNLNNKTLTNNGVVIILGTVIGTVTGAQLSISTQPQNGSIPYGSTHELTIAATATEGTLTYQWYKNTWNGNTGGTAIDGATNTSYTTPVDNPIGAYYYYCVVTANGASYASRAATVAVAAPAGGVASVGGTKYDTLQEAFDAISNGSGTGTVKLLVNLPLAAAANINSGTVTLDLNGYAITESNRWVIETFNGAKLIVEDTSTGKTGRIEATGHSGAIRAGGDVTINSGTIQSATNTISSSTSEVAITVNGGTVLSTGISGYGIQVEGANNTITINGGTVEATHAAIFVLGTLTNTTINIKSGTVRADTAIFGGDAVVNIEGGTVACISSNPAQSAVSIGGNNGGSLNMSGGTIIANQPNVRAISSQRDVTITGGNIISEQGTAIRLDGSRSSVTCSVGDAIVIGDCTTINDGTNACTYTGGNPQWSVRGAAALLTDVAIFSGKTFSIPTGGSLTVPSGKNLTNNGTITNSGTLANNGTITSQGTLTNNGTFTSTGTLTNNGTFTSTGTATGTGYGGTGTVALAESFIKLPSNLVYNGTAKEITVSILDHVFAPATDYTVAYSPDNINGGEVTATVTSVSGGKLTGTPVEKKFTITQSSTAFTGGITTDKADKTYTYGETITVTVTPKATGAAPAARRAAPTAGQMALFLGDTQVSDAAGAVSGTYTMTIDTKDKTLAVGSNTITAKYVGTASMADYSETVTVTLNPKPIASAMVNAGTTKDYDGTAAFTGVALTPNAADIFSGDTVTGTAAGNAAGANAGTHSFTATEVTISGAQSSYYSLAASAVSGNVDITAIDPSYNVAEQKIKIKNSLTAVQRLQSATGVSNETVEGALTWSKTSSGAALDDTFTFEGGAGDVITLYWTFAPTSGNYKALSGSTAFTLTTKDVPILTVNNISKTYDGTAVTTVSGTAAKADGTAIPGTFAFPFGSGPLMKDASIYTAVVSFTPTDTTTYETASIVIIVIIEKATITIKAKDKSAFVGDAVPTFSDADYTVSGLGSGETLTTLPSLDYAATPDMSKAGSVAIIASGAAAPDGRNYNDIVYQPGTLTISTKGGGGGGGSGGGGSTPTPPVTPEIPNPPTTVETGVNSKTDKDGNATATVADKDITNAIDKAQKEAKKNGTEANGIAITLNVKTDKNATTLRVTLLQKSVSALIAANVTQVTINNGLSTITLDLAALNALKGGDVVLTITKVDVKTLSAEAQNAIGNRPVFRFGATVGGKAVTDFKGGRVGLQMPYTRSTTEQVGNLCTVYVDGNGKLTWLENSSYDPITSMMLASTSHFSIYGVGYKQSTPKFTDVGTHWAKNDIDFVVARGLLSGTSTTTFAPETSMTRGMFVTALGRLAGVDTKKYSTTKFTDVKTDAYYAPYVAWANVNNIVNGTSDTTFSPDKAISRQEMAVMLVNYSKAIGYKLPGVHAQVSFTDASSIASWAKDAVGQMQMAGILMGKSGNRFDPTATATRAEVSAMLRRYVELVISSDTAEGWAMNESGQWMYIQDGKRITGKKNIDGTAYTFDQYGVTTALPPERKYGTHIVQRGESFWGIAWKYKVSMFELAKVNGKTIFSIIYTGDELKIPQQ